MTKIQVGDSVRINNGVMHADDLDLSVAGWQGRVHKIDTSESGTFLDIALDSETLKRLSDDYIVNSFREGLFWQRYSENSEHMVLVEPRDTPQDVLDTIKQIKAKFAKGYFLVEEAAVIKQILGDTGDDSLEVMERWYRFMKKNLKSPFVAVVNEMYDYSDQYDSGEIVRVMIIRKEFDEHDGLIAKCRKGVKRIDIPLRHLQAKSQDMPQYKPLDIYRIWFTNR